MDKVFGFGISLLAWSLFCLIGDNLGLSYFHNLISANSWLVFLSFGTGLMLMTIGASAPTPQKDDDLEVTPSQQVLSSQD
jgi:hypothetical protein